LIVFLFALFILLIGGLRLVNLAFTLKQISPAIGIPMGYVYLVLPVTGALMMLYAVYFIYQLWIQKEVIPEEHHISTVD
jgi:TRAP-type C4-dicarboxylate transport system permease small subunit